MRINCGDHAVGGRVWVEMADFGLAGEAEVVDIQPCPEIPDLPAACDPRHYRLVTGTFRHISGEVYDLKLASESKPIGVTGSHPFWSVDREAWVSVLDLEIGETLKTLEGTTVVESRIRRPEPAPVYNIEVEGDHVYRVGESGVLVHNASVPDRTELINSTRDFRVEKKQQACKNNLGGIIYVTKCKTKRIPTNFPTSLRTSVGTGASGHTERRIKNELQNDPDSQGRPGSIRVLLLYTERSPCESCEEWAIPDIRNMNESDGPLPILYLVERGEGFANALRVLYGFASTPSDNGDGQGGG